MKVAKAVFVHVVAEENPRSPPLNESPDTDLRELMAVVENEVNN